MAALTPFAPAIAPVSAMRAIGATTPTVSRTPLIASPPLLAAQITGRYRAGMHRATDSITPFFVRRRRAAAVGASTAQSAPMETDTSDFDGASVSRAKRAAPMASASRAPVARASAGALWMGGGSSSSAPLVRSTAFTPVSRSFLGGAPPAAPSSFFGAPPSISLSPVAENGGERVNRATVPSIVSAMPSARPVLRSALSLTALGSPAGGLPVVQTRPPASVARAVFVPAISSARPFAPLSASPTSAIAHRAPAQAGASFAPAASTASASTAGRAATTGTSAARQTLPSVPRLLTQAPFAGRVSSDGVSAATAQTAAFPTAVAARSVARTREPFVPVLSAARFDAPSVARIAERTTTPNVPAPGRPSVPQALWRQAAPDAPFPVERGSGAGYAVSQSVINPDFTPLQNALAARNAPIEAYRSPLDSASLSRRGGVPSTLARAFSTTAFRGGDETAGAPNGVETTAPEPEVRVLSPFVPRSATPFVSRAATAARAMALPTATAFLSMTAALAQPPVAAQTGPVARRAAPHTNTATVSSAALVSRTPVVDRAPFAIRPSAVLPSFAPTVSRVVADGAAFRAPQATVNRQAAFVPVLAAQAVSTGLSFPSTAARAVPLALSRSRNGLYRVEETNDANGTETIDRTADRTSSWTIRHAAPGFAFRQFAQSVTANGGAAAFLSPVAARAVTPIGSASRMPLVRRAEMGAFNSPDGPQTVLARYAVSPASFVRVSAPIARAFAGVTAFRAPSEPTGETAPETIGAPVLRDFQIARVFAAPAFASSIDRPSPNAPSVTGVSVPRSASAMIASSASANAFLASGPSALLSRQSTSQNGGVGSLALRAALPVTTLLNRAPFTIANTAPFSQLSQNAADRAAASAPARATDYQTYRSEAAVSPSMSPVATSRLTPSRASLPTVEGDHEVADPAASFAGGPSAARSIFTPPLSLARAPLPSALSLPPNAPVTVAARQDTELPGRNMGTVVPRFVARLAAAAAFAPPVSAFVNRNAPSVNAENSILRAPGEPGETPSVSQPFQTRGAAHEMARTLRDGTLTTASLARQPTEPAFEVQRAVDGSGDASSGAPAPGAGGGAAGGAGGGGNPATDLMAIDRQVDVLWDRFMQRLRIEQERAGFH